MGVFCEDIREEEGRKNTIVGVLPDNLNVPQLPAMIPKLCIYVRIAFDPRVDALPVSLWLVWQNRKEEQVSGIDQKIISAPQASAFKAPDAVILPSTSKRKRPARQSRGVAKKKAKKRGPSRS